MKKALLILALTILAGLSWAMEWPVSERLPVRLFGQRSEGIIERGIVLEDADIVRAAGHGTLLMTLEQNSDQANFPGTLGNAVILAHDEGLITVYGNLEALDRLSESAQIESQSILAKVGSSGWGKANSLFFEVIDQIKATMLNPLLLLPTLKDSRSPTIKNVIAISRNDQIAALGAAKSVRQGKYRLYANISDTLDGSSRELSPFRVTVIINGSEAASVPFETLKARDGQIFLSAPEYTWQRLYSDPERIYLGEVTLTRGRADVTIIARDPAGNEKSVSYSLQIE